MSSRLAENVNPLRLAEARQILAGYVPVSSMKRLAGSLSTTEGQADVELEFGEDAQKVKFVRGRISAKLSLVCQRCLQPMEFPIDVQISLGLVSSDEEAEQLPANYDPLMLESANMSLWEMIEDELILACPIVALHPPDACDAKHPGTGVTEEIVVGTKRPNPFAELVNLKKSNKPTTH